MTVPQLRLYVVATQFADGIGGLSFALGFTESMGVGYAMQKVLQGDPAPRGQLTNIMVQEVDIATVRALLQSLETGTPSDQRVVPLRAVGPAQEPVTQALSADTEHRSDVRPLDDPAA